MKKRVCTFEELLGCIHNKKWSEELRGAKSYKELGFFARKGWFEGKWLDEIFYTFCEDEKDSYSRGMSKEEKFELICRFISIEGWESDSAFSGEEVLEQPVEKEAPVYHDPVAFTISPASIPPQIETKMETPMEQVKEPKESVTSHKLNKKWEAMEKYLRENTGKFQNKKEEIEEWDFKLVRGLPVRVRDNFKFNTDLSLDDSYVVLWSSEHEKILAMGRLVQAGNPYHVVMEKEDIDFAAFSETAQCDLLLFGVGFQMATESGAIYQKRVSVELNPLPDSKHTLCIDFGTSNTCAGTYGILEENAKNVEIVKFPWKQEEKELFPTILYVVDCKNPDDIQYAFGYEALEKVESEGYETKNGASVFFELKHFIGALDKKEKIFDEQGNFCSVPRGTLVQAYLENIIHMCEEYFKVTFHKLHFSSPVKLKSKFFRDMKSMLEPKNYELVPPHESLDEGIAIIYHNITKIMTQDSHNDMDILILDCGGGTTDLASCHVFYEKKPASTELRIQSRYVNGDPSFGGNNITYRILQLLKIKLTEKSKGNQSMEVLQLITHDEEAILDKSDELLAMNPSDFTQSISLFNHEIYGAFQRKYEECEEVLPTQYLNGANNKVEISKKRRNYYYLWQLAEKIKIRFYETDITTYNISEASNTELNLDSDMQEYYIYTAEGKLQSQPIREVSITSKELHRLLCGDIYCMINSLLLENEKNLQNYDYYKLAGQSCKISLFKELLKEFIPGRQLRLNTKASKESGQNSGSLRLKRDCIEGCVQYIRDKDYSDITPEITTAVPQSIYTVAVDKGVLLHRDNLHQVNPISYRFDTKKVLLSIESGNSSQSRSITMDVEARLERNGKVVNLAEILHTVSQESYLPEDNKEALQDHLRDIDPQEEQGADRVLLIFAVLAKEGYGFHLYFVEKQKKSDETTFTLYETAYENFEDEAMTTFFDGSK